MKDFDGIEVYTEEELQKVAKEAYQGSPLTQRDLADLMGVSPPAISHALRPSGENMTQLRLRLIELLGKKRLVPRYVWFKPEE